MKLISRLLLWQKFAVLGVLALALVGVPSYLYFTEVQKVIDFAQDEQRGIEPLRAVVELYKSVQDHRGLAVQHLSDVASAAEPRQHSTRTPSATNGKARSQRCGARSRPTGSRCPRRRPVALRRPCNPAKPITR
jgi:hypothetical protein